MNTHNNIILTTLLALALSLLGASPAHAQFADCSTGLLQMPTAEMQDDGITQTRCFMKQQTFLDSLYWSKQDSARQAAILQAVQCAYCSSWFNGSSR